MKLSKLVIAIVIAATTLISIQTPAYANAQYILNGYIADNGQIGPDDDLKQIDEYNEWYNRYTDYPAGYSLIYPRSMVADVSLSAVRTVLADDKTKIEIYHEDFTGSETSSRDYVYYGNRALRNSDDNTITEENTFWVNGYKTHFLKWQRRKLAHVENDKNYYVCADLIKSHSEVYTIFIKSSQPIENEMDIIRSFQLLEKQGQSHIYKKTATSLSQLNRETQNFYSKYFSSASKLTWGIFEPSAPETFSYLTPLETSMNYTFPILLRYQSLEENVPLRGLERAYENGRYVELTLQTVQPGVVNALQAGSSQDNAKLVYQILDGQYDDYLRQYASRLKGFSHPVLFRLNNEMNGDWCWYSAYYTSKDADLYIALWKYVHSIFTAEGVDNILWIWNPHDVSRPAFKWNHYLAYYPGDEYVDIVGMTGYNTGTYFPGETWREFEDIYDPLYNEYNTVFTNKPFMLTEFASNSVGGNKAAWIERMFSVIKKYPNIKAAIWWSGIDYDQNNRPGRVYLIDEDEAYLKIFRDHLNKSNN